MSGKRYKFWILAAVSTLVLCGVVPWALTRAEPAAQEGAGLNDAARDRILTYIRERFGVPDNVKLSLGPLHTSTVASGFNEAIVTVDNGTKQAVQPVLISRDRHYLIVIPPNGGIQLSQKSEAEMAQRVRDAFKIPADTKVSVGDFKRSPSPDFQVGTLTIDNGKQPKRDNSVLLSRDGKYLIVSELLNLAIDPREQALHTISLHDEATQGPADAPVTIVEYADLECPTCARMNDFLETQVVPRYGNKVRIVFKEYPLPMHDWSRTAAIACQCAYEINPASYVPLRSAIFRNQQLINITNVRETLLNYGEQAGLNRVQLAGCLDAESSYPRVQRDMAEAKRIDVSQTPTSYINGKIIIGLPSEQAYFQAIDQALRNAASEDKPASKRKESATAGKPASKP